MVKDGRTELERDPHLLTTLTGSITAGSTYSIGNFICQALSDLAAHPHVLAEVRAEIRTRNEEIGGCWDISALSGLVKLESAMKETARLTPGTLLIYSRVVQRDHMLSNGTMLRKGQFVTISGPSRTRDEAVFARPHEYQGLRFCANEEALERHRALPFSSVDTDVLTWGSGRWACPGRYLADMTAKIFLIKLIDEYDVTFVDDVQPGRNVVHEFLFFHPQQKMLMRRREDTVNIRFTDENQQV
ncbi:cytochrome P450 [Xylariomycetidae sp. FL2044]|nr:cytochrome P450 [Xylariomycetidae sp. FL2044]